MAAAAASPPPSSVLLDAMIDSGIDNMDQWNHLTKAQPRSFDDDFHTCTPMNVEELRADLKACSELTITTRNLQDAQKGRVEPKLVMALKDDEAPALIVGAGVAGLAAGLVLSDLGIQSIILDQRSEDELFGGAGINLQAKAVDALNELGIPTTTVVENGQIIRSQSYYLPDGRIVCKLDKSGKEGAPGQIAIHRGKLVQLLLDLAEMKGIKLLTNHQAVEVTQKACSKDPIVVKAKATALDVCDVEFHGPMVLGADGIHSNIRDKCVGGLSKSVLHYHGVTHYRGVIENFPRFLDGSSMVVAGGLSVKVVMYPISDQCKKGLQTINWVVAVKEDKTNDPEVNSHCDHILDLLESEGFNLGFVDLQSLITKTPSIQAWPMVDLDPLETWVDGCIGLIGDAAHAMLPVGSGGAMAALFDALALSEAFKKSGDVPVSEVLRLYQVIRYDSASLHQSKCRRQPAENIVQKALKTVPEGKEVPHEYGNRIREAMKALHNPPMGNKNSDVQKNRVLIIGAGASGLAACKEFAEKGFHPLVGAAFGGVFRDAYPNLELTSSNFVTAFSDYPPTEEVPTMWTASEYLTYLHQYAVDNGIFGYIQFNSKVIGVRRIQGDNAADGDKTLWSITVHNASTKTSQSFEGENLVISVGSNAKPSIPTFSGQEKFCGTILHTSRVDNFEMFKGKRVLSLGIGESGSDVPYWIAKEQGAKVTVAVRGMGWCVPRRRPLRTGSPTDLNTNRLLWGLPRVFGPVLAYIMAYLDSRTDGDPCIRRMGQLNLNHPMGIYRTYGTKSINFLAAIELLGANFVASTIESMGPGNRVRFADGSEGEYDIVLLNTGYTKSTFESFCFPPSMEKDHDATLFQVLSEASYVRNLFKRVVHPAMSNLYFIGFARPAFGSIPAIAETQSRWAACLASGTCAPLPSERSMQIEIAADKFREETQFGGATRRVTTLVDYLPYVNDIASLLGATPPYLKLLFLDPHLFIKIFFGPATVAQFRIRGPDAKPDVAASTIRKYPPIPMRRMTFISMGLYVGSLLVMALSLAVPVSLETRKSLQPVGFPPLRNSTVLALRYTAFWLHTFALAYFYSRLGSIPIILGSSIVICICGLETIENMKRRKREQQISGLLTSSVDKRTKKMGPCVDSLSGSSSIKEKKVYSGSNFGIASSLTRIAVALFVGIPLASGSLVVSAFQFLPMRPTKSAMSSTTIKAGADTIKAGAELLDYLTEVHSFDSLERIVSGYQFQPMRPTKSAMSLTTIKAGGELFDNLTEVHNFDSLERIALTCSGNMQVVFSAYHQDTVSVSVDHFEEVQNLSGDSCAVYERKVSMRVADRVFCKADSEVLIYCPEILQILKKRDIGLGQLFELKALRPLFTLHDAGRNEDGGIWRLYSLECEEITCKIRENFSADAWEKVDPK